MLGMAGETPFDLHFRMFGIPVRVHPFFWLTSALMFWDPDHPEHVILGAIAMFISVLVHELGHAAMFRHYGWQSDIVLYAMGGFATGAALPPWKYVRCVAAGPLVGLIFWAVIYALYWIIGDYARWLFVDYPSLSYLFLVLNFAGLIVNLMNLVPVVPLDGGQIMATLLPHYRGRGRTTTQLIHQISIATAGAIALWSAWCLNNGAAVIPDACFAWLPVRHAALLSRLQPDPKFNMIFFGYLCAVNIIEYNNLKAWR